jgi:hypothetical protein
MPLSAVADSAGRRITRRATRTITFDGASGSGATGTVTVFTVTGRVLLDALSIYCTTSLAGASAAMTLGVTGNTSVLLGSTTATNLTAGKLWSNATPPTGYGTAFGGNVVAANLIITISTAAITGGVVVVDALYRPLSSPGLLS